MKHWQINMDNKVFVVNRSGHDFSPAEKYGEIVYMTVGNQNPWAVNQHLRIFADYFKDSTRDDYIVLSGLHSMNAVAFSLFGWMHGQINVLIYDARQEDYKKFTLQLDELTEAIDEDT